jgi:NAD(P)-dependent dehydrogenase (short-subunit alcohol dehydrogenase family)
VSEGKVAVVRGGAGIGLDVADTAAVYEAIVFLASDDARFITGQTLSVSGGLTMA